MSIGTMELSDARVWLQIMGDVLQTDGYKKPIEATDSIFKAYKERFPHTGDTGTLIECMADGVLNKP